jgi:hypothetical protein
MAFAWWSQLSCASLYGLCMCLIDALSDEGDFKAQRLHRTVCGHMTTRKVHVAKLVNCTQTLT